MPDWWEWDWYMGTGRNGTEYPITAEYGWCVQTCQVCWTGLWRAWWNSTRLPINTANLMTYLTLPHSAATSNWQRKAISGNSPTPARRILLSVSQVSTSTCCLRSLYRRRLFILFTAANCQGRSYRKILSAEKWEEGGRKWEEEEKGREKGKEKEGGRGKGNISGQLRGHIRPWDVLL